MFRQFKQQLQTAILFVLLTFSMGFVHAALPNHLNYQGYLTNTDGSPVNNPAESITFTLYDSDVGGNVLWSSTQSVNVVNGVFSVELGGSPISLDNPIWIGIAVGADPEMVPRRPLDLAVFAAKADDANTLTGKSSTDLDQSAHITDYNNPHQVTAAQVGATTPADVSSQIGNEALGAVKAADGAGSGLDADLLDGNDSTAFMLANTDNWVNTTGDTMTGALTVNANVTATGDVSAANVTSAGDVSATNVNASGDLTVDGNVNLGGAMNGPLLVSTTTPYSLSLQSSTSADYINFSTSGGYVGYAGVSTDPAGIDLGTSLGNTTGSVNLVTNGTPKLTVTPGGYVGIGTTDPLYAFEVYSTGSGLVGISESTIGIYGVSNSGTGYGVEGYSSPGEGVVGLSMDNIGVEGVSANNIGVEGRGGSGSYDFYAAGSGTNYGPFTGGHDVVLSQDVPSDVKKGMIVSATGKVRVRKDDKGNVTISTTMPTVDLSSKANDKAVFGVFDGRTSLPKDNWYKPRPGERTAVVNALGEGRVWVSNINGNVENGDYITTSAIAGYGEMQGDDLLHSYTLGKATESVNWDSVTNTVKYKGKTFKVYLIAVVYTSG